MVNYTHPEAETDEQRAYLFCRERFESLIRGPGGARKLRMWLEECSEALQSPPYQPKMSAAERVYVDILVDRASNLRPVSLTDRACLIIKMCSPLPLSGAQNYKLINKCEFILEQVRKDKEKIEKYLPQGDVGRLKFEVCHFLCKEECGGNPHYYQAYIDPHLIDERARWVEVFTGHNFQIKWEAWFEGSR